jgi:type I restriction enzyme R subunit
VPVEHRTAAGDIRTALVWLVDWEQPATNDWLVVHQYTVVEAGKNRRADVVVFLNGLPIALLELKNPGDAHATLRGAWNQVQTYRHDVPALFTRNALVVISDGTSAAMGSFTAGWEHYAPWKTIDGREVVTDRPALEVLIRGVFDQRRLLDLLRSFIVYSDEPAGLVKRVAKYHQYWAVNAAVESTIEAAGPDGDRRGGVVWHTQGSGKSIEMLLYAAKIMRSARMAIRRWCSSQTATIWTTSCSVRCSPRRGSCPSIRARQSRAPTCARCCPAPRVASSLPPSRSSPRRRSATCTRC